MTLPYRFDRQELEDHIQMLAEKYPKCFFANPGLRRPLKKNIVEDLQKDGIPMAVELISTTVDWYNVAHPLSILSTDGGKTP